MTAPPAPQTGMDGNVGAQVLIALGQIQTDVAVIKNEMARLPDHEQRIRSLERWKYSLPTALVLAAASATLAVYQALHP